jgi:uncharacterized membrane protein
MPVRQGNLAVDARQLAKGLAWFGIALGIAEVAVPRIVSRLAGAKGHDGLIRGYGMREIASGIRILAKPRDPGPMWLRVAGDAMDLAALGATFASDKNRRGKTACAIAAVAGVTALDVLCAQDLMLRGAAARASASIVLHCPIEECYRFWRNFENHAQFMPYVESVRSTGSRTAHWIAALPGKKKVEWNTEITKDLRNEQITWHSVNGSGLYHAGTIRFSPSSGDRGTVARIKIVYREPVSGRGVLARLLGKEPDQMLYKDLRRFKQLMETGEVITTEGQSAGRRQGATWLDNITR